jgi:predicted nucleic acid-binding protein
MLILVDSGILLRLVERNDPQHAAIRVAVRALRSSGDELVTAAQNAAEFWNVCTRPATAREGYSLSIADADRRLRVI